MTASPTTAEHERPQARIARMIRAYMAAAGERQADLATLLNVDQTQISRILAGRRKLTVDELELIADHYDRHPGAFFEGLNGAPRQNWKKLTGPDHGLRLVHDADTDGDGTRPGPGQMTLPFRAQLRVVPTAGR